MLVKNPILSGFYPDPSICAVGEDFYLVTSTFCYFPGLPVFHSKDLCHWKQIGNVLDRASQLECDGHEMSRGLFAPTIRYHEGVFYVICTNVSGGGNFVVTATEPSGPWSDPVYIKDAPGIDPSLFFDEDGKCYYIGTRENPEGAKYNGDWYIWIQEMDLETKQLIGDYKIVWNGSMKNVIWPEGPHLYKKNGYYYILHAEGGTADHHAVAVCRSKEIFGPYENNRRNPIFTHRHLGKKFPVQYVGHADLVETTKGDGYAVMLAVRPEAGLTTLGRETFLAKVEWEEDWPVFNAGVGMLQTLVDVNLPIAEQDSIMCQFDHVYDFTKAKELPKEFVFLRSEAAKNRVSFCEDGLKMAYGCHELTAERPVSYLGLRQQNHSFTYKIDMTPQEMAEGQTCGLMYFQNSSAHVRLALSMEQEKAKLRVITCHNNVETCLSENEIDASFVGEILTFSMYVSDLKAEFSLWLGNTLLYRKTNVATDHLSIEKAGGFIGCTVGPFAVWNEASEDEMAGILIRNIKYLGGQ